MWRFLLILPVLLVILLLLYGDWGGGPASAEHYGHLIDHYYVQKFTEDIPNSPGVTIPVYDCSNSVQNHPAAIQTAVSALNSTDLVRFEYVPGGTACFQSGPDEGFPMDAGRIAVFHHPTPTLQPRTADYLWDWDTSAFRQNDIGTEGDVGMYTFTRGRIRLSDDYQSGTYIAHELGHAAGLADLYVEQTNGCGHKHNPDTTIMDCSPEFPATPGQHDIDNLNDLYKKRPAQVTDLDPFYATFSGSQATVWLAWTDRSFNEKVQNIWIVGDSTPLVAGRDVQLAAWTGLALWTTRQ